MEMREKLTLPGVLLTWGGGLGSWSKMDRAASNFQELVKRMKRKQHTTTVWGPKRETQAMLKIVWCFSVFQTLTRHLPA